MLRTTAPGQSPLLLLDVVEVLIAVSVPYAVIGALAASYHGTVRASMDADALIALNKAISPISLVEKLKDSGFRVLYREADLFDPIAGVIEVQDSFNNKVDLLLGIRGVRAEVFSRVKKEKFFDETISIVGLEDFIAMKIFAGSTKDLEDAKNALDVSKEILDVPLVKSLVENYDKEEMAKLEALLKP